MGQKTYPSIGLITLNKPRECLYTISMNNKKILVKILLSLAFLAGGSYVYAGDAFDQLNNGNPNFDGSVSREGIVPGPVAGISDLTPGNPAAQRSAASLALEKSREAAPAALAAAPTPPPPPPPTPIKDFLSEQKTNIVLGGIGAYLGYAILGTMAGAMTGGLFLIAFAILANL